MRCTPPSTVVPMSTGTATMLRKLKRRPADPHEPDQHQDGDGGGRQADQRLPQAAQGEQQRQQHRQHRRQQHRPRLAGHHVDDVGEDHRLAGGPGGAAAAEVEAAQLAGEGQHLLAVRHADPREDQHEAPRIAVGRLELAAHAGRDVGQREGRGAGGAAEGVEGRRPASGARASRSTRPRVRSMDWSSACFSACSVGDEVAERGGEVHRAGGPERGPARLDLRRPAAAPRPPSR